jgi:hypothetical protein
MSIDFDSYVRALASGDTEHPGCPRVMFDWYTDATRQDNSFYVFRRNVRLDTLKVDYAKCQISFTIDEIGKNFVENYFIKLGAAEDWGVALTSIDEDGRAFNVRTFAGAALVEHSFVPASPYSSSGPQHHMVLGFTETQATAV